MNFIFIPKDLPELFAEFSLFNNKDSLQLLIREIVADKIENDITINSITQGKSGAGVVQISYTTTDNQLKYWIVKFVNPNNASLVQTEKINTYEYALKLYPNIKLLSSCTGAIALPFVGHVSNFSNYLINYTSVDVTKILSRLFSSFRPWYKLEKLEDHTFFNDHILDDSVTKIAGPEVVDMWKILEKEWVSNRGYKKVVCHGDLNLTNILINEREEPIVIDFATTGYKHWATDFVRLERQLRFKLLQSESPETIKEVINIFDKTFLPNILPSTNEKLKDKIIIAIYEIRKQANIIFHSIQNDSVDCIEISNIEEEYFCMLAFQQLCLLASNTWKLLEPMVQIVRDSTTQIMRRLLYCHAPSFYFGYFYHMVNDFERILIKQCNDNKWEFPISGIIPQHHSINKCINDSVVRFINENESKDASFPQSIFSPPEIIELSNQNGALDFRVDLDEIRKLVKLYFFKIKMESKIHFENTNTAEFVWVKKTPLFDKNRINTSTITVRSKELLQYINKDKIFHEFGFNILECADIIVFKLNDKNEPLFLLLHRRGEPDEKGWEYPKGGITYHETPMEGAIRELLEETGIRSIGDFRLGGYLGVQTPKINKRKKYYNLLRVHGLTYYFSGDDDGIKHFLENNLENNKAGEHNDYRWSSFDEAKKSIWMKEDDYPKIFLDRWFNQKSVILRKVSNPVSIAFEITEKCNHTCKFCHRRIEKEKQPCLELAKDIIAILAERGVLRLTFTGGEPINIGKNDLFKLIKYANSLRIHTCLSTTGLGITEHLDKEDFKNDLNGCLDHILISIHAVNKNIALLHYNKIGDWEKILEKGSNILEWVKTTNINVEVCTVVTKGNVDHISEIGEWIISKNPNIFWRIDEYYPNGSDAFNGPNSGNKENFTLSKNIFSDFMKKLLLNDKFKTIYNKNRLKFNSKESRYGAPDLMITPQGNLVHSSNCEYKGEEGGYEKLLTLKFKNRRPWSEYRSYCRTDWDWENYFS